MKTREKYLKIFTNLLVISAIILGIVFIVPRVISFFMPFVIGWLLARLANPIVKFMESHLKIVRKHSIVVVIIGALALVILIIYVAGVNVVRQTGNLIADIPQIIESVQTDWNDIQKNLSELICKFRLFPNEQCNSLYLPSVCLSFMSPLFSLSLIAEKSIYFA